MAPFEFADGTRAGLLVRRAVAEFVADPDGYRRDPDVTLTMTGQTWHELSCRPEEAVVMPPVFADPAR